MKVLPLLALVCCSIIVVLSESTESKEEALLARASAQLERLAPYRRTSADRTSDEQWLILENAVKHPRGKTLTEQTAFEIYKILPEDMQNDVARKIGVSRATIELLGDPTYMAMMQDRIKRSGSKREIYAHDGYESHDGGYPREHYGGYETEGYGEHHEEHHQSSGSDSGAILKGSGSIIGGIAKGIIGGLVSASSSASKGSSSFSAASSSSSSSGSSDHKKPEYGHVYSYDDKAFDVWDFKKAIISTLMQAVKAISGGVIALKGQLLKGSGYLVSTKGKIITKTGDAITNLGRNIAKSAVHQPAPQHHGYTYDHPPESGHEETYDGPPPSVEEFADQHDDYHGNSHYESPSEVDDQAGLLIVKPTKPDEHDHHNVDVDSQKPPLTRPEGGYHGPPPGLPEKDVGNAVISSVDYSSYNHGNQPVDNGHSVDRPPSSYDVPIHQHALDDHGNGQNYPVYPPLTSGSSASLHGPLSIQQSVEYPPIHIQYAPPNKGSFDLPNGDTTDNDLSIYSSLSIGVDPKLGSIKISPLKNGAAFELPESQPYANLQNIPLLSNTHAAFEQPLKIPLLKPLPSPYYWPYQGLLRPYSNLNVDGLYRRRSSAQRRRSVGEVAHRMRQLRG